MPPSPSPATRVHVFLLLTAAAYFIWSGFAPNGHFNWLMETLPAIIGGAVLVATYRRFVFTDTSYALIWLFSLILMTGGHYTYAEVPIGNWARDTFSLSRNHFDRIGHFFQGVIPAMVARELLIRTSPLKPGKWLFTICAAIALAISASYELFEWWYAVTFGGKKADDFLGSQGDIWDAQNDMLMALIGAAVSLTALGRVQDRQMGERAASVSAGKQ